jgi:gentisate 1,2-dioxygenase
MQQRPTTVVPDALFASLIIVTLAVARGHVEVKVQNKTFQASYGGVITVQGGHGFTITNTSDGTIDAVLFIVN